MESKQRNRILTVLFFGVLMGALDIAIVGPALPEISAQFQISDRLLSWMFSIYVLFNLIGTPLMAKLSDLKGRRSIYILDVALFAAGSLLVAFSSTFWVVLVGRAIQGFGAGGIFPVASAVIGDTFPVEKRGSALGLIGAVFGIAFIIGPILGGVILSLASWHWLFIINIPIAIVIIVMAYRLLPTTRPAQVGSFDWKGMLVLALLLASLAIGINQIDTANFLSSLVSVAVLPFLAAFVIFLFIFIRVEKSASNPIIPLILFSRRQMSLANALSFGAGFIESSLVFMPLLAVAALGIKAATASFMLMPLVIAMSIGSPTSGRLLDRFGSKVVLSFGTLIAAIGTLMLSFFASSLTMYIVSTILIGFGLSALLGAPLRYIMLNEARTSERSVAQGVTNVFISVGQLLGSALVGALAASAANLVVGYSNGYRFIGVIGLILFGLTFLLKSRSAEVETQHQNSAAEIPA
ncbi:MAG: MFS transporter [Chloroflexi bacterium 44-23]|nr:MAG: MFS transporter [Chloroflexi bacterium 44-23]